MSLYQDDFDLALYAIQNFDGIRFESGNPFKADATKSHSVTNGYLLIKDSDDKIIAQLHQNDLDKARVSRKNAGYMSRSEKLERIQPQAVGPFSLSSPSFNGNGEYKQGAFYLENCSKPLFSLNDISNIEIISESQAKDFLAKVGWGTAALIGIGTVFSGGLALLGAGAAVLSAGNKTRVTFLATLSSNEQCIISCFNNVFTEIKASLL